MRHTETKRLNKTQLINKIKRCGTKYFEDPKFLIKLNSTKGIRTEMFCKGHTADGYLVLKINSSLRERLEKVLKEIHPLLRKESKYCKGGASRNIRNFVLSIINRKQFVLELLKTELTPEHKQMLLKFLRMYREEKIYSFVLWWDHKKYNKIKKILLKLT